jgi:WD40 repeat protein
VYSVSFSPRGDLLAAGYRTAVLVWNLKTLRPLKALPGAILKARFSPDGHFLLTASTNGLILWNVETWGAKRLEIVGLRPNPLDSTDSNEVAIGFSTDGDWIGAVSAAGVRVIRTADFQEMRMLQDSMPRIRFIGFSPSGGTLAACTTNETDVKLWNLENPHETRVLLGHSDSVYAACFTADGNSVATGGADHTIKFWDVRTGSLLHTFRGHEDEIWDLAFSPNGKLLASVSKDGAVKLWDCARLRSRAPFLNPLIPLGFTAKGDLLGLATNNALVAFNPATLEPKSSYEFSGLQGEVDGQDCRLLEDGRTLTVPLRSREQTGWCIRLWDVNEGRFTASLAAEHPIPAYAPTRGFLAAWTPNDTVTIWQLPRATQKYVLTNSGMPAAFSADGTVLAAYNAGKPGVTIWKIGEDNVSKLGWAAADVEEQDGMPALSPDGTLLALGEWNGSIGLWSIPSGRRLASLIGHKRSGISVAFSRDGKTLASISDDCVVRLWHVASARELLDFQLPVSNRRAVMLMFSQDGHYLIGRVWSSDGFLTRVFYAPSFSELASKGAHYSLN